MVVPLASPSTLPIFIPFLDSLLPTSEVSLEMSGASGGMA